MQVQNINVLVVCLFLSLIGCREVNAKGGRGGGSVPTSGDPETNAIVWIVVGSTIGLMFVVGMIHITISKCRNCCRKYDCCHKFTDCGHRIFCEDNVVSAADLVEAEYYLRLRALASALKEDRDIESLQNRADMSETSSESGISQVRGDTSPPPYEDVVRTEMLPCRNAKDKSEDSSACDENDKDIKSVHARDVEKERGVVNLAYEDKDIVVPSTSRERGVACWGSDDEETGINSVGGNTAEEVASKRVYETDMVIENVNEECVSSEDLNENDMTRETRGTLNGNRVEVSEASGIVKGDRCAVSEPRGVVNGDRSAVSEPRGGVNGERGAISEGDGEADIGITSASGALVIKVVSSAGSDDNI